MYALRMFWARSLLNRVIVVSLVGLFCCCPALLAPLSGRGGATPAAPTARPSQEVSAPQATAELTAAESTEAPAPSAAAGDTTADPAVADYARTVGTAGQSIAEGLQGLGRQLGDPRPADQDWIVQTAFYTVIVEQGHADIVAAEVPAGAEEVHAAITDATGDCDASMKLLRTAIDARDVAQLEEAAALMTSCNEKIQAATPMMEAFVEANR